MSKALHKIDKWRKTSIVCISLVIIELGAAYIFGSLALDSGHLWQYALAGLLLLGGVKNLVVVLKNLAGKSEK